MIREIHSEETGKLYECLETLAEHHNKVYVHFKGSYPKIPSEERIKQFENELEEGKSRIAVIENGNDFVGFCKIGTEGNTGVLEYLVVLSRERGKGYGAALMDWALTAFRKLGLSEIDVKVVYGNEAIRLYEKYRGFGIPCRSEPGKRKRLHEKYGFREKSVIMTLKR